MRSVSSLFSLLDRSFRPAFVSALAGVLLAAGALSAQAQSPVSTVKDNQGNDLMQIFDNGDLRLFQNGALTVPGPIETTGGALVLQDGTTLSGSEDLGLSLPFSSRESSSATLLTLAQAGGGRAGVFVIDNSSSSANALEAQTDGSGAALFSVTHGSGPAGVFQGRVGIETSSPGNPLEVAGKIESTTGGIVLPDNTIVDESSDLQLRLPFSKSGSTMGELFELTQTGDDGPAVRFAIDNPSNSAPALRTETNGSGDALQVANNGSGNAIRAETFGSGRAGVFAIANSSSSAHALEAETSGSGDAVHAISAGDDGFEVENAGGAGFQGRNVTNHGVFIREVGSPSTTPPQPSPKSGFEVVASADNGVSVGRADKDGVLILDAGEDGIDVESAADNAGEFGGDVRVEGDLNVNGSKNFKIDHPQNPTGAYLKHTAVESPERKTVYDGTVTTGPDGYATVQLPDYFEALNRDFRYQLTPIGTFTQAIVAEEISGNSFVVRTKKPNVKVSWEVTGIRTDAWAEANPLQVEQEKPARKQGTYLNPEAHGAPPSRSEEALEQRREKRSPDREEQKR